MHAHHIGSRDSVVNASKLAEAELAIERIMRAQAELPDAEFVADLYNGPGPLAELHAHWHFDYTDPVTGHLEHDFERCVYCRVKRLRRIANPRRRRM